VVAHAAHDANDSGPEQSAAARTVRELPLLLIAAGVIAFLIKTLVAQAFYIPSASMVPQLKINDRVVVSKISYKLHDPHRGDIVVFDAPAAASFHLPEPHRNPVSKLFRKIGTGVGLIQPSTEEFIKRVVGLPGDSIDIKEGKVFVNGHELVEPYLPKGTITLANGAKFPITIPKGSLWVMGDNRGNSSDSRFFGPIPQKTVVGRTILKVWPLTKASFL
jgi:signal peptidase I